MPARTVFDRPLRRDPILVLWALLNALVAAASLNSHTTWSGSLEWARVVGFIDDVATMAMLSYLLLALLPALMRRRWRGPNRETAAPVRSAWAAGTHAGLEPSAAPWGFQQWPYPTSPAPTLFDRPLRHDPIVFFWLLFISMMALVALNRNTTWSGSLEAARVASFLADVTAIALVSFLLLCLLPAYLRWCWRGAPLWWSGGLAQWAWRGAQQGPVPWSGQPWTAGSARWGQGGPAPWASQPADWPPTAAGQWDALAARGSSGDSGFFRQSADTDSAAPAPETALPSEAAWRGPSTPWQQSSGPHTGKPGPVSARTRALPSFTKIDLPAGPLPLGVPVPLSWRTDGAHSVTINGKPGYPPSGSADVTLDATGQCSLTAEGPGRATRHAWTAPVPVIELPTPHIQLPAGPGLSLQAEVDLSDGRGTLANTLRTISESRLAFRPTAGPAPTTAAQKARSGLAFDVRAFLRPVRSTPAASRPREASTSPGES